MKKYYIILLILICTISASQAQLNKVWDKDFGGWNGGKGNYLITMIPVIPTATITTGQLLAGYSNSNASLYKNSNCLGGYDYWVMQMSSFGTRLWDKTFGGINNDQLTCMVKTNDGGYLLGGSSNSNLLLPYKSQDCRGGYDYWIIKIDVNGNKLWDKTIGGSDKDILNDIVVTPTGYLLVGESSSTISFEKTSNTKGVSDYWIVKVDLNGNKIWDKTIGGSSDDIAKKCIPFSGGYLIGGSSSSPISGDKTQNTKGVQGDGLDYWVVKITPQGTVVWDIDLGGLNDDELFSVAIGKSGTDAILLGRSWSGKTGDKTQNQFSLGGVDAWVVKIAENANKSGATKVWDKALGGDGTDMLYSIEKTVDLNFLLCGESSSITGGNGGDITYINKGGGDYWIVKIDEDGNKIWDQGFGGLGDDCLSSIKRIPGGGGVYMLGGYSTSNISGDKSQNTLAVGALDYWVINTTALSSSLIQENDNTNPTSNIKELPAKTSLNSLFTGNVSKTVTIYDINGKKLTSKILPAGYKYNNLADFNIHNSGVYLIQICGLDKMDCSTHKISVVR